MAIYDGNILSGILGKLVIRNVNHVQIISVRPAPGTVKQTEETKKASNTFGKASSLGSCIRQVFKPYLRAQQDSGMSCRMTTKLNKALIVARDPVTRFFAFEADSFDPLNDFDFNRNSPLKDSLMVKPEISITDQTLGITFQERKPGKMLKFQPNSSACEMTISVALFRLEEGLMTGRTENQQIIIEKKANVIHTEKLMFNVPDGCLCIVTIFLKYYNVINKMATVLNNKKFHPSGICAALMTPGVFEESGKYSWEIMPDLKFPSH